MISKKLEGTCPPAAWPRRPRILEILICVYVYIHMHVCILAGISSFFLPVYIMTSYSLLQIVLDCMFILKHYSDAGCDVNKAACFIACSHVVYMLLGLVIEVSTLYSVVCATFFSYGPNFAFHRRPRGHKQTTFINKLYACSRILTRYGVKSFRKHSYRNPGTWALR